jgi:hypothetical protein
MGISGHWERPPSFGSHSVAGRAGVLTALSMLALGVAKTGRASASPTAGADAPAGSPPRIPDAIALGRLTARLAPTPLRVSLDGLAPGDRQALPLIIAAAEIMDTLFLRQAWSGNGSMLLALAPDVTRLGRLRLHAFLQNKGPWSRLDGDAPFMPGVGPKPPGATFYPADSTKGEIEAWMKALTPDERREAGGFFTVIRRTPDRHLRAVPYSIEYQPELGQAAALLRQAAALTVDAGLRSYLEGRAAAFLDNDYRDSDRAWMRLDGSIEPTIGPYEVYEDGWFNAKAAFEAFVTIRDDAATRRLAHLGGALQDIEDHLPIDPQLRNPKLGAMAPIRVVNSVFGAGDANRGVQTAAFNLPNDEATTRLLGTKRTLLKNVQEAKFEKVLLPIARQVLAPADLARVSFDAFFTHILMHELMHGLGPHQVHARPEQSVRAALEDAYSVIEEAKADISGLFALQYLLDRGTLEKTLAPSIYPTFVAYFFRALRFGSTEAHAQAVALQLNALLDAGAVTERPDGTFEVHEEGGKLRAAVAALTAELMTLEASGDHAQAARMVRERAVIRPAIARALQRLSDARIPVDIEPRFVTAAALGSAPAAD